MTSPGCHPRSVGAPATGYSMHPLDEVPCARRVDLPVERAGEGEAAGAQGGRRRCQDCRAQAMRSDLADYRRVPGDIAGDGAKSLGWFNLENQGPKASIKACDLANRGADLFLSSDNELHPAPSTPVAGGFVFSLGVWIVQEMCSLDLANLFLAVE